MTECISRGIPNVSTIENLITAQSNQYSPLKKGKKEKTNHGKSLYTFIDSDLLPSNSYSKKKKIFQMFCKLNWENSWYGGKWTKSQIVDLITAHSKEKDHIITACKQPRLEKQK